MFLNFLGTELRQAVPGGGDNYWLVVMGADGRLYRYPKADATYCREGMGECRGGARAAPALAPPQSQGELLLASGSARLAAHPLCRCPIVVRRWPPG